MTPRHCGVQRDRKGESTILKLPSVIRNRTVDNLSFRVFYTEEIII